MTTNGSVSFWWEAIGRPAPRPALPGALRADVCIVGGGLHRAVDRVLPEEGRPGTPNRLLEKDFCGFGASGRNGGWLTNSITGGREQYLASHGREAARRFQTAMNDTVDEVIRVAAAEGIDADITKGGEFTVARNAAQQTRLRAAVASEQSVGQHRRAAAVRRRDGRADRGRAAPPAGCGIRMRHASSRRSWREGWRGSSSALGVELYEGTAVTEIAPGTAITARGTVTAEYVVRATEGFTAGLNGLRRSWLPMNSSLIITEPLAADVWRSIRWDGREVLGDLAHAYMYAQRTADDRIAIGGRGVPYRYGSRTDDDGEHRPPHRGRADGHPASVLPGDGDARVEHAWSGVLGVPRDWAATVGLDRASGLAWAGGYVGTGVATTNLAGRTLTDLILGVESELTTLPWVNHRVRSWEPEPLRWLAVRGLYAAYRAADRAEASRRSTTSPLATMADIVSGRRH